MLKNICIFILKNPTKHTQGNYVRKHYYKNSDIKYTEKPYI